uniref:Regulator of G-protein signaling 2 n=1 Tax=Bos indicus x Bos taurus TaxID=30522 RepID=A0A4W2E2F2_BOBOX
MRVGFLSPCIENDFGESCGHAPPAFTIKRLEEPFELLLAKFLLSWEAQNWQEKQTANLHQTFFCRPSPEEAQLWSEAFDELLASKYGLAAFRAFLKSEFCEENIEFWLACEDFKKTKSPQKLSSKAKKIYTDFIEKEAPKEINIDFQTKTLIAQNIQEATSGCFTTAQKRVYSLMENNSYPRFLESEFYQDLCKKPQITTEPHAT